MSPGQPKNPFRWMPSSRNSRRALKSRINQRFGELIEKMDVIDKWFKDQDRRFQEQDQQFEPREQLFQRRDEKSVEMKEGLGRNCKTGGLPGQ